MRIGCVPMALLLVIGLAVVGAISAANRPPARSVAASQATAPRQVAPYDERLDESLALVAEFEASDYTGSVQTILLATSLFNAWSELVEEGRGLSLSEETARRLDEFATAVRRAQKAGLPILRDKYGPAVRELLWEDDITARTVGAGFRTIQLAGYQFAANRNIKEINESHYPTLMRLRFTRAEYRWYEGADRYTYYNLSPPADDALAVFYDNGAFRAIE